MDASAQKNPQNWGCYEAKCLIETWTDEEHNGNNQRWVESSMLGRKLPQNLMTMVTTALNC